MALLQSGHTTEGSDSIDIAKLTANLPTSVTARDMFIMHGLQSVSWMTRGPLHCLLLQ